MLPPLHSVSVDQSMPASTLLFIPSHHLYRRHAVYSLLCFPLVVKVGKTENSQYSPHFKQDVILTSVTCKM